MVGNSGRSKSRRPYHHGDLRRSLVSAGLQILEGEGMHAISLRAVARLTRVSHNAPYHHFANKAELLAAVAAAGFDRLVEAIEGEARQAGTADPLDRLRATGRAYIRFAVHHPSLFRLMFRPELTQPKEHPLLQEAEGRAFGSLVTTISLCQQQGRLPGVNPLPTALFCWSTVHGMSTLYVDQVLAETPLGALPLDELVEGVVSRCMHGATEE